MNRSFLTLGLYLFAAVAGVTAEDAACTTTTSQVINDPQLHAAASRRVGAGDYASSGTNTSSGGGGRGGVIALTKRNFEVPLPPDLPSTLNSYLEKMGILPLFEDIALPDVHEEESPYEIGETDDLTVRGYHWWLERSSVSHVIAPENDISYGEFLSVLKQGGFDTVLQQVGDYFTEYNTLTVYHASIHGIGEAEVVRSGMNTFSMIIPIVLAPEDLQDQDDYTTHGGYHYNVSSGLLLTNQAHDDVQGIALVLGIGGEDIPRNDYLLNRNHRYPTLDSLKESSSPHWSRQDSSRQLPDRAVAAGDFVLEGNLQPAQIVPLRWAGNPTEAVDEYAHQVGLPEELTKSLLDYCNDMGITDTFKQLLVGNNNNNDGKPLQPGRSKNVSFKSGWNKYNWYIQRPDSDWASNMHWISPSDKKSHNDYLKALSRGGFDQVLDAIGKTFGLEGLVAYQVTFIGVSHCELSHDHMDFEDTGGSGFNVIIPLILADSYDEPELDIHNDLVAGSYKYQLGVASMVGDDCHHATSPIDYRPQKEMRMAATIYVADVDEDNVAQIMRDYTQKYPPKGDYDFLLSMAGSHWQRGDPSVTLPR